MAENSGKTKALNFNRHEENFQKRWIFWITSLTSSWDLSYEFFSIGKLNILTISSKQDGVFRCIQNWNFFEHSRASKPTTILLKSSIIDIRLGSKYTSDCFPKDISLTYYSDLLHLLEAKTIYLDFQNRNLLWNFKVIPNSIFL